MMGLIYVFFVLTAPNYVGCYKDSHDRDLPEAHIRHRSMTGEMCVAHCRENGYHFAGVVSGAHLHSFTSGMNKLSDANGNILIVMQHFEKYFP